MMYSFDFAAQITRICMDEIRRRGMEERKILRKSAPSSVLFLKVFREQSCTPDDVTHVSIHSVATLMQDTLWCSPERIVPQTVWRVINYETCTLSNLSRFISRKGEQLLVEILDFLVELMQHKDKNLMAAYYLGEAMGKVTLGPADCDPIIAEKASHFMTRLIIEHSKRLYYQTHKMQQQGKRVDSGFAPRISPSSSTTSGMYGGSGLSMLYHEMNPMSKAEAARAKAKSYDRIIHKIKYNGSDWASNTNGIQPMLDDAYPPETEEPEEPWISIFCTDLDEKNYDPAASPLLFRILSKACKPQVPVPDDPFATSYLFQRNNTNTVENQITHAFNEFAPLCTASYEHYFVDRDGKTAASSKHFKKINHSLSHMKINLRKPRSQVMDSEFSNDETIKEESGFSTLGGDDDSVAYYKVSKQKHMKSMMRKALKMGSNKKAT